LLCIELDAGLRDRGRLAEAGTMEKRKRRKKKKKKKKEERRRRK
jgi:hypothetical protein